MSIETSICPICGAICAPGDAEDETAHQKKHTLYAKGVLPYEIREFLKEAAYAYLHSNNVQSAEAARRAIAFARWHRAREGGIPLSKFDEYMGDMLAYLDDQTSEEEKTEISKRWKKYG